jgi:hypothetical protein
MFLRNAIQICNVHLLTSLIDLTTEVLKNIAREERLSQGIRLENTANLLFCGDPLLLLHCHGAG